MDCNSSRPGVCSRKSVGAFHVVIDGSGAWRGITMIAVAINAIAANAIEKLLTPDQLQRLSAIRGGAQVCPIVPAFGATGLLVQQ